MQIPNFNQLKLISLLAAVRSLCKPIIILLCPADITHSANHQYPSGCTRTPLSDSKYHSQIMSLAYSTIAIGLSINDGRQPGVEYNLDGESVANGVFNAMTAFGTIAFAYGGHNVVLEIQVRQLCALFCRGLSNMPDVVFGPPTTRTTMLSAQFLYAELQATLPSPPPTLRPYMRGVYLACEHLALGAQSHVRQRVSP